MARGPIPDKPATRPAVTAVLRMLEEPCTRPNGFYCLHAQLEDGNLGAGFFTARHAQEACPTCRRVIDAMAQQTPSQRRRVALQTMLRRR